MKKTAIFIFAAMVFMSCTNSSGKKPDHKDSLSKDSVQYVSDRVDTVRVANLAYKGDNFNVKWTSPGYLVYKSRVATKGDTITKVFKQELVTALDSARNKIQPITQ